MGTKCRETEQILSKLELASFSCHYHILKGAAEQIYNIFLPFIFVWHKKYEVSSKIISLDDDYLLLCKVTGLTVGMFSLN